MGDGKKFFLAFFAIILLFLLAIYWFVPFNTTKFNSGPINYNFSLNASNNTELQFYPNLRFSSPEISYRIYECPLQRQYDMETAFNIIQEKTILSFYSVEYGEEIFVTCQDENVMGREKQFFIAGEGGPTNITVSGDFNIIYAGEVLLIKDSGCERPNIAIHELLHALGFDHSQNPNNIMYEFSRCDQTISEDMIDFINKIYSVPTEPDLTFQEVNAFMNGKYLNANFSIRNNGLIYSGESKVIIVADGKKIKEIEISPLDAGEGMKISLSVWIAQINVKEIEFIIENDFFELDKTNNNVSLEIKK
ncbi:MAG: CARDB domain-containing protein [Candidatus Diapherotrites archaeon]